MRLRVDGEGYLFWTAGLPEEGEDLAEPLAPEVAGDCDGEEEELLLADAAQ